MTVFFRACLAIACWLVSTGIAFAAASSVPTQYTPDPALRTASRAELEARIRRACTVTQARLQSTSESALTPPCSCYASRVMRSFSASDLDAYRATGYFDDSGRAKALEALDSCKLRRPI
jgi:hypothetical protein